MTEKIFVSKLNEVHLKIRSDDHGVLMEIRDHFTFTVPGHKYMKAYKEGRWDGKIRLFDYRDRTLYVGLYDHLKEFAAAEGRGYEIVQEFESWPEPEDELVEEFIRVVNPAKFDRELNQAVPLSPHDYQIDAVTLSVQERRKTVISPTASGKSLIIYLLIRWMLMDLPEDETVLLIVPTTTLVDQMYSDFEEYSLLNGWSVSEHCRKVYSGMPKSGSQRVIISTWQSAIKMPKSFFDSAGGFIGDEAQGVKAKSLIDILEACKNASYRIGTTGTLDDQEHNTLTIEGLLGPVEKMVTTAELIARGLVSDVMIDMVLLDYVDEDRKACHKFSYANEIDFLESHSRRNEFILNVATDLPGNTLVLFKHKDHGEALYEEIKKVLGDKRECYLIHGGVDTEERTWIRQRIDSLDGAVVVASYGTFSTGINMPEIHNLVMASPYKSQIKVLQSIGRALRKSRDGRPARVIDVGDDLSWKKHRNFALIHSAARLKIYKRELLPCRVTTIKMSGPY